VDDGVDPAAEGGVERKTEVAIWAGSVEAGSPGSGVEADKVANRSVVGVGLVIP
jgi:hypothetical protein